MTNISNGIIFVLSICTILFIFYMFYFHPFHFLSTLSFYKTTFVPQNYCYLQIITIIISTTVMCTFPSTPYLSLIPLGLMIVLTLVTRPHLHPRNTTFSLLNSFSMSLFPIFNCHSQTQPKLSLSSNTTIYILLSLIIVLIVNCLMSLFWHCFVLMARTKTDDKNEDSLSKE